MYGLPPVVAINKFPSDTDEEVAAAKSAAIEAGAVGVAEASGFAQGGAGMTELAEAVWDAAHSGAADVKLLYEDDLSTIDKVERISEKLLQRRRRGMGTADQNHRPSLRVERLGLPDLHG